MENRITIRVPLNQMINEDTTALKVLFQTKYLRSKAMAKYMSAIRASKDARFSMINNRLKKLDMIARLCPLNQPTSKIVEIMWIGMLMAMFSMSTTARLARRVFETVRKDLKGLCHETAHARQLRVNLKRLAQLFQVSRDDLHTEFIALNLGHPRIFFAFGGFVI